MIYNLLLSVYNLLCVNANARACQCHCPFHANATCQCQCHFIPGQPAQAINQSTINQAKPTQQPSIQTTQPSIHATQMRTISNN